MKRCSAMSNEFQIETASPREANRMAAIIIILGPATGAAINPARYLGAVFMQGAFGGSVSWGQLPAYVIGEVAGGMLGGLAYVGIARVRTDAAMTSLAPDVAADEDRSQETVSGATS
jgi:Major intrinsic protein